jgi:hypothetical protein
MQASVFLSHNHKDKDFVRKLAGDIDAHGVKVWIDEAEMKIGDSLVQKIREGIDSVDYFAVILSENSVEAPWVVNELDVAMNYQIQGKIKILPIVLSMVEPPSFLVGKLYGNFTNPDSYNEQLKNLINSMGVAFNSNVISERSNKNLVDSLDAAVFKGLPIVSAPFHRPFQYLGMSIADVEGIVGEKANSARNIIVENEHCKMVLWGEGNFISFIDVDLLKTGPHSQSTEFDSEPLLGALSIGIHELELNRKKTHCHTYYDHKRRMKVTVMCSYESAPLTVSFGTKYYNM